MMPCHLQRCNIMMTHDINQNLKTNDSIDNWSFWLVKMSIDPLVKNTQVKKTMLKLTCPNRTKLDQGVKNQNGGLFY
jgi:hypothetical protein